MYWYICSLEAQHQLYLLLCLFKFIHSFNTENANISQTLCLLCTIVSSRWQTEHRISCSETKNYSSSPVVLLPCLCCFPAHTLTHQLINSSFLREHGCVRAKKNTENAQVRILQGKMGYNCPRNLCTSFTDGLTQGFAPFFDQGPRFMIPLIKWCVLKMHLWIIACRSRR